MAVDVALDLSEVLLFAAAVGLALVALVFARALASVVRFLPFVGDAAESALTSALVKPLERLANGSERRMVAGLSSLLDNLAVLLGIPLLIGIGVYKGLEYLWHEGIKRLVHAASAAALKVAHQALALARTAEKDAKHALHVAESIPSVDVPKLWRAIESKVSKEVNAGVNEAEAYTAKVEHAVNSAVAGAAAEIPQLADLDYDELKKLLDGEDLAKLGGLLLAVPLLHSLIGALAQEAGLGKAECRAKNADICGTDATQWAGLLAALVPIGLAFDLQAIVDTCGYFASEVETLVAQAA